MPIVVKSSSVYLAVQKITPNFAPLFNGKVCNELEIRRINEYVKL